MAHVNDIPDPPRRQPTQEELIDGDVVVPVMDEKPKICDHCGRRRRDVELCGPYTAYVDDKENKTYWLCEPCEDEEVEYWNDMWSGAPGYSAMVFNKRSYGMDPSMSDKED